MYSLEHLSNIVEHLPGLGLDTSLHQLVVVVDADVAGDVHGGAHDQRLHVQDVVRLRALESTISGLRHLRKKKKCFAIFS